LTSAQADVVLARVIQFKPKKKPIKSAAMWHNTSFSGQLLKIEDVVNRCLW